MIDKLSDLIHRADVGNDQPAGTDVQHPKDRRAADITDADKGKEIPFLSCQNQICRCFLGEAAVFRINDHIIESGTGQTFHSAPAAKFKKRTEAFLFHDHISFETESIRAYFQPNVASP